MAVSIALSLAVAAPWPFLVLVASLLGFLVWNWSPRVFMGDVGSTFLGAVLLASFSRLLAGQICLFPPGGHSFVGRACFCVPRVGWSTRFSASSTSSISTSQSGRLVSRSRLPCLYLCNSGVGLCHAERRLAPGVSPCCFRAVDRLLA